LIDIHKKPEIYAYLHEAGQVFELFLPAVLSWSEDLQVTGSADMPPGSSTGHPWKNNLLQHLCQIN